MRTIADSLLRVRERIAAAAQRAGRETAGIELVAVTKGHGPEEVRALWQLGLRDFGESRVQEALQKIALPLEGARWHLIGHLQENKINKILPHVHMIQSIDSLRLAQSVSSRAERSRRQVRVCLEVKTSPEESKHGISPEAALDIYPALQELPGLEPLGLMTLAPFTQDVALIRASFRGLRKVFEKLQALARPPGILSMGMSDDLEIAIEEGSTMVRVGRALWGHV